MSVVHLSGGFDNIQAPEIRLMEEAALRGPVALHVWSDDEIERLTGKPPGLPLDERLYWLRAVRYLEAVEPVKGQVIPDELPWDRISPGDSWIVRARAHSPPKGSFCQAAGLTYEVISEEELSLMPASMDPRPGVIKVATETGTRQSDATDRKKVVVTGCYDYFHSGHVRFFEEVSALGALHVVIGHDANVRALKGVGHPMFPDFQRWYMVQSIRHVTQAHISSGDGWLDAAPEIRKIKPHIYAVNNDGDKSEKRQFCEENGIEYVVLDRKPKEGLPRRSSTDLRGF